jgi:hypothetical protein
MSLSVLPTTIDEQTRAFLLEDDRLARFLNQLLAGNRRRVRLSEVWSAFVAVYIDLPEGPQRRQWLLTVLERLAEAGSICLPVRHGRQWDRTSSVALPGVIKLSQADEAVPPVTWQTVPWHPKLQWVLQRRYLSNAEIAFLLRVNQGLVEGWFNETEPFKYRSLQLTGDEKRLAVLAGGALFGPNKLNLEMLGCQAEVLPLAVERISSEPTMLLFENAAPFMLARSIQWEVPHSPIGCLGYGAGKQMIKSVRYLSLIQPKLRDIIYVGDLDGEGIQLAATVSRLSTEVPVRAATQFHLAMFEAAARLGSIDGWPVKDDQARTISDTALQFLDSSIRASASKLVEAGRRIPEEVISRSSMHQLLVDFHVDTSSRKT